MTNKQVLTIAERTVTILRRPEYAAHVVYAAVFAEQRDEFLRLAATLPATIVAIDSVDWNREFSPWPAPKVFPKGDDFAGEGDAYIHLLTHHIMPAVTATLPTRPTKSIIAGYSLAGLCALYALYCTDVFQGAVCASASLWYDDFISFMETHHPAADVDRVYFSLGDREAHTKNHRLACVADCMREAGAILRRQGIDTTFEWNQGNHFVEAMPRLVKGIQWILV